MILSKGEKSSHAKSPSVSLKVAQVVRVLYWERYFFAIDSFFTFFKPRQLYEIIYVCFL